MKIQKYCFDMFLALLQVKNFIWSWRRFVHYRKANYNYNIHNYNQNLLKVPIHVGIFHTSYSMELLLSITLKVAFPKCFFNPDIPLWRDDDSSWYYSGVKAVVQKQEYSCLELSLFSKSNQNSRSLKKNNDFNPIDTCSSFNV